MTQFKTDTAVVMAAFNAEQTIIPAVASILASTLPVDLYVVDDCSERPMADHLSQFRGRIEVIRLGKNMGPANARNAALKKILSQGYKYVAISDSDDLSYATRFEKQRAYLDAHDDVAACATSVREFDGSTDRTIRFLELEMAPAEVKNVLYFNSSIAHPAIMYRCDMLRKVGLYSNRYPAAEDYELLRRIAVNHKIASLSECLVDYRVWPGSVSHRRRYRQLFDRLAIQWQYFEPLNWRSWAGLARTVAVIGSSDRLRDPWRAMRSKSFWRARVT